jgi:hypothetical protein
VPGDVVAADARLRDALLGSGSKRHATAASDAPSVTFATLVPCASGGAQDQLVVVGLRQSAHGGWDVTAARLEPIDLPRSLNAGCVQALQDAGMPEHVVRFIEAQLENPQAGAQLRWSSKVAKEPVFEFEGTMPLYSTDHDAVHSGPYYIRLEFTSRSDGYRVLSARFGPHRDDHEYKRLHGGVPRPRDIGNGSASTLSTASEAVSVPSVTGEGAEPVVTNARSAPVTSAPVPLVNAIGPSRPNEPWIAHPQLTEGLSSSKTRREALPGCPVNRLSEIRIALRNLLQCLSQRPGQPRPDIAARVWAFAAPNELTWYVQFANDHSNIVLDVRQASAGTGHPVGRFAAAPEALFPAHNHLNALAKARWTMDSLGANPPVASGASGNTGYSGDQVRANVALLKAEMRACKQAVDALPELPPAKPNKPEPVSVNGLIYHVTWADSHRTTCVDILGPYGWS